MVATEQEITIVRTIAAPPSRVYPAFTTAEGWCAWCCESAEADARVGGRYHIYTDGYNAYGEYTLLEPDRSVAFSWDGDGEPPMRCRVALERQDGGTRLVFAVWILGPAEEWVGFAEFLERTWGRVLDNLKRVLEGKQEGV